MLHHYQSAITLLDVRNTFRQSSPHSSKPPMMKYVTELLPKRMQQLTLPRVYTEHQFFLLFLFSHLAELSISSSMSMTTVSNPDGTTKTSATSMVIVTTSTHQPEIDVGGLFCQWLKKPVNYNKYGAFWKASKVPELVERELAQNGKTFSQMAALQDG